MYAVYLIDTLSLQEGYFSRLKTTGNAKEPFQLVFSTNESNIKLWKSKLAAIKYANTLSIRLKTVGYQPTFTYPYLHQLRWNIRVVNMCTGELVHNISTYKFRSGVG